MLSELTNQDRTERDAIIADIHAAFAGVALGEHGISWSECYAIDLYEPEDVCRAARHSETETHWSELIARSDWHPFPGIGGFSFINGEGVRYYLPPTMIRFLNGDDSEWFPGHLLGVIERFMETHLLQLWSEPQLRSIARFVSYMARHDSEVRLCPEGPNPWAEAIGKRWHAYLPK